MLKTVSSNSNGRRNLLFGKDSFPIGVTDYRYTFSGCKFKSTQYTYIDDFCRRRRVATMTTVTRTILVSYIYQRSIISTISFQKIQSLHLRKLVKPYVNVYIHEQSRLSFFSATRMKKKLFHRIHL